MAAKKALKALLTKEEYEATLAFHDIAEEVLGNRLEKMIVFGRTSKQADSLDILFLVSEQKPADTKEINLIAEDLSESVSSQISPVVIDQKTYQKYQAEANPLISDVTATGIEFKA